MPCTGCGGSKLEALPPRDIPFRDFPGAVLVGVPSSRCAACGAENTDIPDRESLLRLLGEVVVRKADRSTAQEVLFVRQHVLGWTPKVFARRLGVNDGNAWKWERGQKVIPETADKLTRLLAVARLGIEDFPLDLLDGVATREGPPLSLRLVRHAGGWQEALPVAAEPGPREQDWPLLPYIQENLLPTLLVAPGDEAHTYVIGRRDGANPVLLDVTEPMLTVGRRAWRLSVGGSELKQGPFPIRLDSGEDPRARGEAVVRMLVRANLIASRPRRPRSGKNATTEEVRALLDRGLAAAGSWAALAQALDAEATALRSAYDGRRNPHRSTFDRWTKGIGGLGAKGSVTPPKKHRGKRVAAYSEGPQRVVVLNAALPEGFSAELAADGQRIRVGRAGEDGLDRRHPVIELHAARWSVQLPDGVIREGWHKRPHGVPEVYAAEALRLAALEGVVPSDRPLRGRRATTDVVGVDIVRSFLDEAHGLGGTWPEVAFALGVSLPVLHACRQGRRPVSTKELARWRKTLARKYKAEPTPAGA